MAKVGDTVRFLNATGGGKITRIDGKIAYVEEDGFETPVLLKEVVVVLPAGAVADTGKGPRLMFNQQAYDEGKKPAPVAETPTPAAPAAVNEEVPAPVAETEYGDRLNVALAFEPSDVKRLAESRFDAVLVNDSNYTLLFTFSGRGEGAHGWSVIFSGAVEPNELIDLGSFTHSTLGEIERVMIQFVAFKRDREYEVKMPVSVNRKLDLTKFHKLHCFRPGVYFENPVIEIPLISDDKPAGRDEQQEKVDLEKLAGKFSVKPKKEDRPRKEKTRNPADNPHKLLPPIEVDLHIAELTDTTAGMDNAAMLQMQLDEVRKVMKSHSRRIGQKIIFIHGKGEGVLRKEVLSLLAKEYPKATTQDASFREYGFGATLVTVH